MIAELTQFTVSEVTPAYWQVSFSNPPINLQDPDTILELQELVGTFETDDALRVVVFESADPNFFINHYDVSRAAETPVAPGPTGLPTFIDTTMRLATTSVVTIAKIRGRNRGGGAEAALAFDLRFASREKAVFGQPEVGAGMFPGGGALERLPLLVGRARALEIILGSDDFDAETAAQYGWINRALPDDELDAFVESFAGRIASFDKAALAEAKRLVNRRTLPQAEDLIETQERFLEAFAWPSLQERGARLRRRAAEVGPQFELRFGHYLVDLGDQ
jgi:enoyl-CoA hydratase/carnithine racemase